MQKKSRGNSRAASIRIIRSKIINGFTPETKQPCVELILSIPNMPLEKVIISKIDKLFKAHISEYQSQLASIDVNTNTTAERIRHALTAILNDSGMPLFDGGIQLKHIHKKYIRITIPSIEGSHQSILMLSIWIVRSINLILLEKSTNQYARILPEIIHNIRKDAPGGINTLRFLKAAHAAGIPWRRMVNNVFQLGWGKNSRLLDSSLTDITPAIATRIARNKHATAHVLRDVGIPVPIHTLVSNTEDAVNLAKNMGYPVVVKVADKDGGKGVFPGLLHPTEVITAFNEAKKISPKILIEKHFDGRDYRILVDHGDVHWAIHRIPGGVTGNGLNTISELLESINSNRNKQLAANNDYLKSMKLDKEALDLLEKQGVTINSIPEDKIFIRLRQTANISTGGTFRSVLDEAHPDNLALAIRAAKILRLDLAGVDLLMPDIRKSWMETDAIICEVNAQPQLNPLVFDKVLKPLLKKQGRIPIIMVLGKTQNELQLENMLDGSVYQNRCIGSICSASVQINRAIAFKNPKNVYIGTLALISDPQVDLAIIHIEDNKILETGSPVDLFDILILAGPPSTTGSTTIEQWHLTIQFLNKMCTNTVIVNKEYIEGVTFSKQIKNKRILYCDPDEIPALLSQLIPEN